MEDKKSIFLDDPNVAHTTGRREHKKQSFRFKDGA